MSDSLSMVSRVKTLQPMEIIAQQEHILISARPQRSCCIHSDAILSIFSMHSWVNRISHDLHDFDLLQPFTAW